MFSDPLAVEYKALLVQLPLSGKDTGPCQVRTHCCLGFYTWKALPKSAPWFQAGPSRLGSHLAFRPLPAPAA